MKVIIVGGVAGGASAAARLRRLDEHAEIIVFERTGYISYANCGLPYYIGGVIDDPEELTLQTPESFFERFRVDMRVRHEVTAVNASAKTLSVKNLETGEEFEESYDKLILSPGARSTMPPLSGIDNERVFSLRTVEDTFRIKDFVDSACPRSAVVVGGGFIGMEMAENLRELGMEVSIVELLPQLMSPFDRDMVSFIHAEARAQGIKLHLKSGVAGFVPRESGLEVLMKDAPSLFADMVIMAVGVTPDTSLAKSAGLELGMRGSIVVNERMETSDKNIYAVGDAVMVRHAVSGSNVLLSLAGPANKQGRIAADNICGVNSTYKGSMGSSVLKFFSLTAACTGLSEAAARAAGFDTDKVILSPMSHAGYYPGGKVMTVKLVFEKGSFRILGAQIVGYEGVDKRIDVIATAIQAGLTAPQLRDLDLAYAPPYSSAKDPVNMAGFMAENLSTGVLKQWFVEDYPALPRDGSVVLLDTRTPAEYANGHADGFMNIPVDELRERIGEVPTGKKVYVMCQSGIRSYIACRILAGYGMEAYNFSGGYRFFSAVTGDIRLTEEAMPCGADK